MVPSFAEFLRSKQFTFLIGEYEVAFTVHTGAIAALSPTLDCIVHGPMREGQENTAVFLELEVEDFERISEFAYRGEYKLPKPKKFSDAKLDITKDFFRVADSLAEENYHIKGEGKDYYCWFRPEKMKIIQRFMAQYKHSQDSTQAVGNSWRQDFTSVFLGHARLYAFAGQYLIDSLQALALRNIHKALSTYTLFARSVGSINQLAYFAYNNNCIPDRAYGKIDPLRLMVVEFIALRFKYFELDDGHKELMEVEGQYATDLLAALAESYGS